MSEPSVQGSLDAHFYDDVDHLPLSHHHTLGTGATQAAAGTHKHSTALSFSDAATTVVTETAYGQAAAVGVGLKFARNDHTHGTPVAETGGVGNTVTAETAFGIASNAGAFTAYSRRDHTHGTPANPVVLGSPVPLTGSAEADGVLTTLARADHIHRRPKKRIRCTANTANSTVTAASMTGSTPQAVVAGKVYEIRAVIWYTTAATTTGLQPQLTATGGLTATDVQFAGQNQITATSLEMFRVAALNTKLLNTTGIVAGTLMVLEAVLKVAIAGSVEVQFASEVAASAVTILAGSYWTIEEIAE